MEVLNRIQEIFRDIFDDEAIVLTEEISPSDIEDWDSFTQVNILVACESEFKIKFNVNDIPELTNVGALKKAILSKSQGGLIR